jgi:hypothetical protein
MKILLSFILCCICAASTAFAQTTKTFEVDFAATQERIKDLGGVNAGPDVLAPRGATTAPLPAIQGYRDGGVTLIRTHDMPSAQYYEYTKNFWTTQGTNVSVNAAFDPTLESSYNWSSFDGKIDTIINFGFTPYMRLGINFGATFPYPPTDPDKRSFTRFAEICKRTVMHYNQGWASGRRYGIKYWEVWNEPDSPGFWKDSATAVGFGDSAAFVRMYKTVSDSLKRVDATIKVGAAGILSGTVLTKRGWERYFINACRDNRATLDFLSWHLYGALNPYTVAIYGAYMRGLLDAAGFTSTENHVSETNIRLGEDDARFPAAAQVINKPKHAAYMASQLISAQMGSIDRLMVYRGASFMNLFNSDTLGGQPNLMLSGRGFKAFTEIMRFAPQRIKADGSEFIATEASAAKDTTNIMVLAGRADNQNTCYVLVSNYNSRYTTVMTNIKNLPWKAGSGSLTLKRFQMNASGVTSETVEVLQPASSLALNVANMTAPAVALLRLQFTPQTAVKETLHEQVRLSVAPNPASGLVIVKFTLLKAERVVLKLYNALGVEVASVLDADMSVGEHILELNTQRPPLNSATYFLRLQTPTFSHTQAIQVVR